MVPGAWRPQPASCWLPEPAAEGLQTFNNVQHHSVQASNQQISGHMKRQGKEIHNEEKNESIETDSEINKRAWSRYSMQTVKFNLSNTNKRGKLVFSPPF